MNTGRTSIDVLPQLQQCIELSRLLTFTRSGRSKLIELIRCELVLYGGDTAGIPHGDLAGMPADAPVIRV